MRVHSPCRRTPLVRAPRASRARGRHSGGTTDREREIWAVASRRSPGTTSILCNTNCFHTSGTQTLKFVNRTKRHKKVDDLLGDC